MGCCISGQTGCCSRRRQSDHLNVPTISVTVENDSSPVPQHVGVSTNRRGSFLHRPETNEQIAKQIGRRLSCPDGRDNLVTPFAQVMSSLKSVRANFALLTDLHRPRFSGSHNNSSPDVNEKLLASKDETFQRLCQDTIKEFDWCILQLESMKANSSVSDMAIQKFQRILDLELKDVSQSQGGSEISAWVYNTFVGQQPDNSTKPQNTSARAREILNSIRQFSNSRSVMSLSLPKFGVLLDNEEEIHKAISDMKSWDFDVFAFTKLTNNRPLTVMMFNLFQSRNFLELFRIRPSTLINYSTVLEDQYCKDVPFHNSVHAADVLQATNILISAHAFELVFSELEILCALIAAAVHDVDHPGVNNQYLVATNSELALMYNDESVLENHHLAIAFKLMQNEGCDILENFGPAERSQARKLIIQMVLATDNAKHMALLAALKTMVETKTMENATLVLGDVADKITVLKCLLHCADLSNPTRPLDVYKCWVTRLMEEFFSQGDKERRLGLSISPMMDRHNANVEQSQVVFIDYVVHPLWETWGELVYPDSQLMLQYLEDNRKWYLGQTSRASSSLLVSNCSMDCSKLTTLAGHPSTAQNTTRPTFTNSGSVTVLTETQDKDRRESEV